MLSYKYKDTISLHF